MGKWIGRVETRPPGVRTLHPSPRCLVGRSEIGDYRPAAPSDGVWLTAKGVVGKRWASRGDV